ncbi:histidine phosphatase superfamily [Tuber borchii]|uniref:Histidine phosphatase superfamily n=1 Tax=Tuber borchii TaxID=42251 RepID=A0A2T6ZJF0_TUBBO|nr:histidine phosphatase superfamily [Tuber borchii]
MPPRIITLVRHGEGQHNATRNFQIHDALLTPLGETHCHELSKEFPSEPPVDLLVSSPLRRTIQTTLLGFKKQVESGVKVELLAELQEVGKSPCNTGSSRDDLEKEELFKELDFSGLPDDWTSKALYAPLDPHPLSERARVARKWLRSRSESHVVVVLHGNFIHYVTEALDSNGNLPGTRWSYTEFRSYVFVDGDEDNASIIETDESKGRREGNEKSLGGMEVIRN